jgi:hypothetical protein
VHHLVVEDFHFPTGSKDSPIPFGVCQKITLICNPTLSYRNDGSYNFYPQTYCELIKDAQTLSKLELQIGWEGPRRPSHRLLGKGPRRATDIVPQLLSSFCKRHGPIETITIQPFLGQVHGPHKWCFGRVMPEAIAVPPGFPSIDFATGCHCYGGDRTHCRLNCSYRMSSYLPINQLAYLK